jgi:hypothetical protein
LAEENGGNHLCLENNDDEEEDKTIRTKEFLGRP